MRVIVDKSHSRRKKARFSRLLRKPYNKIALNVLTVVIATLSAVFIWDGQDLLGYLLAALASVGLSLLLWREGELKSLPAKLPAQGQDLILSKALDRRALGRIKSYETPYDIWKGIEGSWREKFFTFRYGIDRKFIEDNVSKNSADSVSLWSKALELARLENQESITIAAIYVSLLASIDGYEQYLARLHLEPNDLIVGIDWQRHVELVGEKFEKTHSFGGMARDWSAGYTPLLNRLGQNISDQIEFQGGLLFRDNDAHQSAVNQMIKIFSQAPRPNVVLVGPQGVGKDTTVRSFAYKLLVDEGLSHSIEYNQVISISAPAILSQVSDKQSVETFMQQLLNEISQSKNTILYFENAHQFFEEGTGTVNLTSVLYPVLQSSNIKTIFTMTNDNWEKMSVEHQDVTNLLNKIVVQPADKATTFRIMEDQILLIENQQKVLFKYQALQEAYRLSSRYMHGEEFPGKAISLLEAAVNHAEGNKVVTAQSVQATVEQTQGVKVSTAGGKERSKLLNLEEEIHKHMINQDRAVNVVSDALRRARSGVNNPNKPIGTFMFLGPTGVGKTELAKAIGRVFFGGEDRLVRVDMNNFVQASDVTRLLASTVENSSGLIAQITKQPYSVVLFDEIEKAHPDVVNVFLQLLDEGVLRDSKNNTVSFRDAIIITTSNAGAHIIREKIEAGVAVEEFEKDFLDQLIESNQFRPEFLNRFDEMVVFRPLTKPELLQVVDLLMASVNRNLARQKVQVALSEDARHWLVENGYDARLGARPLRRMIQRSVENIVAKKLLEDSFMPGSTLQLTAAELEASGAKG